VVQSQDTEQVEESRLALASKFDTLGSGLNLKSTIEVVNAISSRSIAHEQRPFFEPLNHPLGLSF
jgi:hypothetical protein